MLHLAASTRDIGIEFAGGCGMFTLVIWCSESGRRSICHLQSAICISDTSLRWCLHTHRAQVPPQKSKSAPCRRISDFAACTPLRPAHTNRRQHYFQPTPNPVSIALLLVPTVSPTVPIAYPAAKPVRPTDSPHARCRKPLNKL